MEPNLLLKKKEEKKNRGQLMTREFTIIRFGSLNDEFALQSESVIPNKTN